MKIAAFNVQRLGWNKINNETVRTNLIKIVSRYSVVVMLEVMGHGGRSMGKFLTELNNYGRNRQRPYNMRCSVFLGRGSYREQFVFFYREAEVSMLESYQYEEKEDVDVLEREPFVVLFDCPNTVAEHLVLIPVHTKPEDAEIELDALEHVVEAVRRRWETDNIIILGDFNADGRYLSKKKKERISIFSPDYHWLIGDDVDTTTSNSTDHTYDRIVVFGDDMYDAVVPRSARAFNFQRQYRLSDAKTKAISDHYPVEVVLREN
ncbi:deoxyribonuclease gamma-like [Dicentrarchus labrax]|uniref:deoxyribonuclease gamma-like n=1 Tax=Dicentrarchus labrax TaxID=13489 RepID=UPI0021F5DDBE|nr:deoxyribonuclease gamma-like [Dicentrarchus labrax]